MNSLLLNLQNRLSVLSPGLIVVGTIAAAAGFLSLHYKAPGDAVCATYRDSL
jgi:hypothetical protein